MRMLYHGAVQPHSKPMHQERTACALLMSNSTSRRQVYGEHTNVQPCAMRVDYVEVRA